MHNPFSGWWVTMVGSRKTPLETLSLMTAIAYKFVKWGYGFRSGGADGADTASEQGARKAIAEGAPAHLVNIFYAKDATPAAMEIAGTYHPMWNAKRKDGSLVVSDYARKLHGRNAFQVLGRNLNNPSIGLICWTPDACECHKERTIRTGGTGTAISIADAYEVPIANLKNPATFQKWRKWANDIEH